LFCRDALREVKDVAKDYQQTNFQSHNDIEEVVEKLSVLLKFIQEIQDENDPLFKMLKKSSILEALIHLFDSDVRPAIRKNLLQLLGLVGGMIPNSFNEMADTLPQPIGEAVVDAQKQEPMDEEYITYLLFVLSVIANNEEQKLPYSQLQTLDSRFLSSLLDICDRNRGDENDNLSCVAAGALLAINIQYDRPPQGKGVWNADKHDTNLLHKCLRDRDSSEGFTQHVLRVFNRADDPVQFKPCLVFIADTFHNPAMEGFFFTNDLRIVVEICFNALLNLDYDDKLRAKYLDIIYGALLHTDYLKTAHEQTAVDLGELRAAISRHEEEEGMPADAKALAAQIREQTELFQ